MCEPLLCMDCRVKPGNDDSRDCVNHLAPHFMRGKTNKGGLAMHLHPSFAERLSRNGLPKKGGGAPKGASSQCPRGADRTLPPAGASGAVPPPYPPRVRGTAGRGLAFRRSTAALAEATERSSSAQAALHASGRAQALPAPSIALKRSTPRPGRSAGGDDARAARGRVTTPARRNRTRPIVRLSPATSLR